MSVAGDVDCELAGASKFTVSEVVLAAVMLVIEGAVATVVPEKLDVEAPDPAVVTARMRSAAYVVLATRPVSVTGLAVPVADAQVVPPSVENS